MNINPNQENNYYYNYPPAPFYPSEDNGYYAPAPFYPSEDTGYYPPAPFYPSEDTGYYPPAPFYPSEGNGYYAPAPFYPSEDNGYYAPAPFYPSEDNGYYPYTPSVQSSPNSFYSGNFSVSQSQDLVEDKRITTLSEDILTTTSPALQSQNLFTSEEINTLSEHISIESKDEENSFPFLSDHPITTFKIKLISTKGIEDTLIGVVWNKLRQGSFLSNRDCNNPWGEETPESYLVRMEEQYKKILNIISSQATPSFFLIQEGADLCKKDSQASIKFISDLNERNWECYASNPDKKIIRLYNAILYDRNKLKLDKEIEIQNFVIPLSGRKKPNFPRQTRALCGLFTHLPTELKIEIASFHLPLKISGSSLLLKKFYTFFDNCLTKGSFSSSPQNAFLIAGGDTNKAKYSVNLGFKTDGNAHRLLTKPNLAKRSQALFAIARDDSRVEVQEGPTTSFVLEAGNKAKEILVLPHRFLNLTNIDLEQVQNKDGLPKKINLLPKKPKQVKRPPKRTGICNMAPLPSIDQALANPNFKDLSRLIKEEILNKLRENDAGYLDFYILTSLEGAELSEGAKVVVYHRSGQETLCAKFLQKVRSIDNLQTIESSDLHYTKILTSINDFSKICQAFDVPIELVNKIIPFLKIN